MEKILNLFSERIAVILVCLCLLALTSSCNSYRSFGEDILSASKSEKEKKVYQSPYGHGIELDLYNRLYCKSGGQPFISILESDEEEATKYQYKCGDETALLVVQNIDSIKIPLNSNVYLINSEAFYRYKRSLNFLKSGQLELALSSIERAISIDLNIDYFWATRGEIFLRMNKKAEAISCMNKVLKISTNHYNLVLAGYFSFLVGKQEKGMRMAQRSISNWPEDERGYAYALCRYARMLHMSSRIIEGSYHMQASCKMGASECCALLR